MQLRSTYTSPVVILPYFLSSEVLRIVLLLSLHYNFLMGSEKQQSNDTRAMNNDRHY